MITEYLETSVLSNVLPQKLVVVQNDSGRNVNVNIVDYKIPAEAAARIWVIKPDGKVVWNNCDIITDQIVKVKLTNQMLAVVGLSKAKIEIYTEDEVLSTFNFYLQVEEDISDPNGTESKNESTALEEIANKIKDYEITVEKGLTSIENKIAEVVDIADGKMRDIDTLTSAKLTDINNTASSQISNITNITNQQLGNINAAATRQIEMIENKTSIQINAINNTALTQIASINNTAISQIENMTVKYSDMCRTLGVEHEGILCIRNLKRVSINVASFKYIKFGKMYIAPTDKKLISTQGSYLFNVDNFGYINTDEEYDISSEKELYCQSEYYHDPTIIVYVEYKLYNESEETTTE